MARTVFVLGAGASREGGAPLMNDFLDVAEELLHQKRVGNAAEHFELVLRARDSLQAVHSKAILNVRNLESVFGAFEMGRMLRRCGSLDVKDIEKLRTAMRAVITTTLEQSLDFRPQERRVLPPRPYDEFVGLVTDAQQSAAADVAVISFNYDVALDYAFHFSSVPLDYGLQDSDAPQTKGIPYAKLHGSGNWVLCQHCSSVQPLNLGAFFTRSNWQLAMVDKAKPVRLNIEQALGGLKHCDQPCTAEALIVPPTWNKAEYGNVIASVWRRAAKEMSEAENIVVIGYSLPPTDQFFQYLFGLGCVGPRLLRRFLVCDPDAAVEGRFRELLAPAVTDGFEHFRGVFSACLGNIRDRLRIPASGR